MGPRYCAKHTLGSALQLHRLAVPWPAIAEMLNAEGLSMPNGREWSAQLVEASVSAESGPHELSAWTLRRIRRQLAGQPPLAVEAAQRPGGRPWAPVGAGQLPAQALQYLEVLGLSASTSTVYSATLLLRRLCGHLHAGVGDMLCTRIDREALRSFQWALAEAVPSAATRAGQLSALRQFLRHAYDEAWLDRDLSGRVVLPRIPKSDVKPIPTPLIIPMLRGLPRGTLLELRDRALVHFLLSTGCRVGEALAVRRSEFDPEGTRVCGFKTKRIRTVYLFDEASQAVAEYLAARGEDDCAALFVHWPWGSQRRRPLTPDGARRALANLRGAHPEIQGLPYLTHPHVLRHTLATALLEATHDARLLQEVLGHQTMRMISVYAAVTDQRKRSAYASGSRFAQLLHGPGDARGAATADQS
jgi:site-specific recombinase XerD